MKVFQELRVFFNDLLRATGRQFYLRIFVRRYQSPKICSNCHGTRLQALGRSVRFDGLSLAQFSDLDVRAARELVQKWSLKASVGLLKLLKPVDQRLRILEEVGLDYLSLSRLAKTLSGGEAQRIRLANQLSFGLSGTLYVLDEPSIGLHPADTSKLIAVLKDLRDAGNTLLVVEHDLEMIQAADWVIEMGPGAGKAGGRVVSQGTPQMLAQDANSLTGAYLSNKRSLTHSLDGSGKKWSKALQIQGARAHNLQNLNITLPLERCVVVTGVSGSGKSSLVHQVLTRALEDHFGSDEGSQKDPQNMQEDLEPSLRVYDSMTGAEALSGFVVLDQSPPGRSRRSNAATYLGFWEAVRNLLASHPVAIQARMNASHFSFNSPIGACKACKGAGEVEEEMSFLGTLKLECEFCQGLRFRPEVLALKFDGHSVAQILSLSVDEALPFFGQQNEITRPLQCLQEVGLGYLPIGQSTSKLSGGENQRIKIAYTLLKKRGGTFYIF